MKLLRSLKRAEAEEAALPIEVQIGLDVKNAEDYPRPMRRKIQKEVGKAIARFGDLSHPVTGERPTVLLYMASPTSQGTVRIKTDSAELRAHLVSKGVDVLGSTAEGEEGHAPAAKPEAA